MFTEDVIRQITDTATALNLEPASLLAVTEVESGGQAFAMVNGRQEPLIRFEGHYFDRRLGEADRVTAREKGLASPVAGAIANPKTQTARWRMLAQAVAIDARAAYESVSWGLGQVMGAHWTWLGYASVEALVSEARSGVAGQTRLMAAYIDKAGLGTALREHDWAAFARGYNGPGYKQYAYDEKIAAAYRRHSDVRAEPAPDAPPTAESSPHLLREGMKGDAVAALQRNLKTLGYALTADGLFGPKTARAVQRFQRKSSLDPDAIVGPRTAAALEKALVRD